LKAKMRLNENERKVLWEMAHSCGMVTEHGPENCLHFSAISNWTGLDRKVVRRACRSLARKGLAVYEKGLWTYDGEPAGAGYGVTLKGQQLVEAEAPAE
jgi:hypothetical protein